MLPKIQPSITDMQKQTVTQLKTALTADMTKRDLLIIANSGSDKLSEMVSTYDKNGLEIKTETVKDVETNVVISTKVITYTLYPKGEVDEITIVETDSKGAEVKRKVIKHYIDGKQPTVTEVKSNKTVVL
jgi:hypothetical protein